MRLKGRHKEDIKADIHKAGETLSSLDAANGLKPGACRNALYQPHELGEAAIAEFLGKQTHYLWPNRHDRFGNRLQPQPRRNYRPARENPPRQKVEAA